MKASLHMPFFSFIPFLSRRFIKENKCPFLFSIEMNLSANLHIYTLISIIFEDRFVIKEPMPFLNIFSGV